ncbi:single-stranded DNA-binding protein [Citricoccus sp.]|uniref:single-stranded DNA-binding protein n=1 Tax=Citricoccus sp. TaxID=1978372 RepID=UPI002638093F|nr:single-stranded DNA-binding protein [Citricoccus sp.]HRO31612.1 single-stranded DNA-binding protein [Citricoccus sp.]HRO95118.1 single-stranded DNA-binding protein [Citricoccus sp.]
MTEPRTEEPNVEGVIVGVEWGQWSTEAWVDTDDGTRVRAHFSELDSELVAPERLRAGTRIRLDVPARYTFVQTEHIHYTKPTFREAPAAQPFAYAHNAEWIDTAGQAHPLIQDAGEEAADIHPGWDQVDGHRRLEREDYTPTALPARPRSDFEQTTTSNNTKQGSEKAMESVGKKTVQGNLTGDPRKVRTKAGQELVVMTVAENGRRFNESSRAWEDTEAKFYDVAVERAQLRENVLASLRKGDRVTVTGDYRVGAYATSTGKPGLNHRIWAEDVAASMQFNPVAVLPREPHRDGASVASSPEQSRKHSAGQGLRPEELTPEAFAEWSAGQPPLVPQQQEVTGITR